MKKAKILLSIFLITQVFACTDNKEKPVLKVNKLECEYLTNPLGIDVESPRLSWKIESKQANTQQKAWQLLVSSDKEKLENDQGDLWNSDTVFTDQSTQVKYRGKALLSRQKVYWKVRVWNQKGEVSPWSEIENWEMAFLDHTDWKAKWIGNKDVQKPVFGQKNPALYFRKGFEINDKPKNARAYISGLGYYELYINGKKVGDHVLSPNQTNYGRRQAKAVNNVLPVDVEHMKKRVLYETFDIGSYLQKGKNTIVAILGNGWYWQTDKKEYLPLTFDTPRMIAQFEIEFADGSNQLIISDKSWKMTDKGAIADNSVYVGEIYDARLENPAMYHANFDDRNWVNANLVRMPKGKLCAQMSPPDRIVAEIKPLKVSEIRKGVYRYDFGRMFSGWVKLKVKGKKGDSLKLTYFEDYGNNYGQKDVFILNGKGQEEWQPRFTWHAFSYVEILGSSKPMTLENVMAYEVNSDVKMDGSFNSSNKLFNTISQQSVITQLGNMHGGVTSDCPHRERRGYTGDGQIAAQAAIYALDMCSFYTKWINDMADAQNTLNGYVPNTVPFTGGGGGVAWGSSYIIVPWYMYLYYGDVSLIKQHFAGMKSYVHYLTSRTDKDGLIYIDPKAEWDLGEWVPPVKTVIPKDFVASAYYYYDICLLSNMAKAIGKKTDAAYLDSLANRVKTSFTKKYLDEAKKSYSIGYQGANVFPLAFGLVPQKYELAVFNTLVNHIIKNTKGHFDTGMMATPYVLEVLTKYGRADLAYTLMNQRDFPSFGYNIEHGATTLWETWDGKASHDHPMFGSVTAWFYQALGGINPDVSAPGFKHVIIKPSIIDELDSVSVNYHSVYGNIASSWSLEGDKLVMKVSVPANTRASVYVPAINSASVSTDVQGIKPLGFDKSHTLFKVPSGNYVFTSKNIKNILKSPIPVAPLIKPLDTTLSAPGELTVTMSQFTKGAKLRYTLDGSEPDETSILYTSPFKLGESTTIKAKVFKENAEPSSTVMRNIVFVDKNKNGIGYKYYEGLWSKLPDFNRLKANRTGKTYDFDLEGIDNLSDHFGLVLTSKIQIKDEGDYTFSLYSNDGSKLFIDNQLIVDIDGLHGFDGQSGKIKLGQGKHEIRIEYFQAGGGRGLELFYVSSKIEKQKVPADILFF